MKKVSVSVPKKMKKSNPNYAEFMAKFWMSFAGVLIAINLFFILTLMQMAPQLKIIAQVLTTPMNSTQLIQTDPLSDDIRNQNFAKLTDKNLIEEMFVRYYLTERYMIVNDEADMLQKWGGGGPVAILSTPDVYQKYIKSLGELPEKIREIPYTQNIDILSISRLNNTWTVEFDIYRLNGTVRTKKTQVARLTTAEAPFFRFFRTTSANLYGFIVVEFEDSIKM